MRFIYMSVILANISLTNQLVCVCVCVCVCTLKLFSYLWGLRWYLDIRYSLSCAQTSHLLQKPNRLGAISELIHTMEIHGNLYYLG